MPGIVGLVTRMPRSAARIQLGRMVAALCHHVSYETGTWIDERSGVYVGWAERKTSAADVMPLCNESGNLVLVFSGEEYPEPEIARILKERGHAVQPDGASYLIHLCEEDENFPVGLNGRFHGLVTDRTRGLATLFNDRWGLHRLYYHESKDAFYFGAEAKAILAVRPELRTLNNRSVGEFVACGCVLENRTLFAGIAVLPPASSWVIESGTVRKGSYFDPKEWESQPILGPAAYYSELKQVFVSHLPRYFISRNRIAMSLTGGLDTRMIMAWQQSPPGSLPCYSFGGTIRESQDVIIARRVARACRQPYEVIPLGSEFLSRFAHYAERSVYITDACTDVSHAPDLYLNELAAKVAPVRMTGNYGGEVLRGVRAFTPQDPAAGLFQPEFLAEVALARSTYARQIECGPVSFAVFRQAPWHHYGLLALEQSQLTVRSPYLDNDLVRNAFRAPPGAFQNTDLALRLIAEGDPSLIRIRTDRGLADRRMTAAVSRALLGFTFKAEYAYDYGMPAWLARLDHALSPMQCERWFLGRHKFSHFRSWYRDALSAYVREMLLDHQSLSRPYVNRTRLEALVQGHLEGTVNATVTIHKLLTLELLQRLFIDV